MADQTLTGAQTEVTLDTTSADKKKKIIKYVLIAVGLVAAFWLVKKYLLKK